MQKNTAPIQSWAEAVFVSLCLFQKQPQTSLQALKKTTQSPEFRVNEQFIHTPDGGISYGSLDLPVADASKVKYLFHSNDTLLDVAHRLGLGPEATEARTMLRRFEARVFNLLEEEAREVHSQKLPFPSTPTDVSVFPSPPTTPRLSPLSTSSSPSKSTPPLFTLSPLSAPPFGSPIHLPPPPSLASQPLQLSSVEEAAVAPPPLFTSPPTTAAAAGSAVVPPAPSAASLSSLLQASAAVGDVWRLTLPQAVSSPPNGITDDNHPTVCSTQFPFDQHLGAWRCEVPSNCLSNPLMLGVEVSRSGALNFAASGLRLDVEACVLPTPGAEDGKDGRPKHA